jgi:hypothetical protein
VPATLAGINLESYSTHHEVALMASKVISGYAKTYPAALKEPMLLFMEKNLKKGLQKREASRQNLQQPDSPLSLSDNILTQCVESCPDMFGESNDQVSIEPSE